MIVSCSLKTSLEVFEMTILIKPTQLSHENQLGISIVSKTFHSNCVHKSGPSAFS